MRPVKALVVLGKGVVAVFAAVAAALASAQPLDGAGVAQRHAERLALLQVYVETTKCMHVGTIAALREGVESRTKVIAFTMKVCGPGLYTFLTTRSGWSSVDAARLINQMAERELNALITSN